MHALIQNNQFVRWVNLRQDYPNTSFPVFITDADLPDGVVSVEVPNPDPAPGALEVAEPNQEPTLEGGKWRLLHTVRPMTPEEADEATSNKAAQVRADRNRRLADTDWTQVADAPVDSVAWAAYRQALRDISSQEGFPFNVTWPAVPANVSIGGN